MTASYKSLKEDFVSNLTGGTISEIACVTAVVPSSLVLWSVLQSRQSFFTQYSLLAFAVDFLLNVGAVLLAITLYASNPVVLNLLLLAPAILVYTLPKSTSRNKKGKPPATNGAKQEVANEPLPDLPQRPFLTTYRGVMLVITCLAILAVDFRIFPRRFAKVENWGTSLMDIGVGSFVFTAGVVGARPILREQKAGTSKPLSARLYKSARHSLPLMILGLVRLYSVKGLDYAEHVTEYGVHWNFFFTLGFLPPFVALFQSAFQVIPSYAALAVILGCAYQAALEFTELKAFILIGPRTDLFSKNREGIFSFFGYLAIYLGGQATGMYVIPRRTSATGLITGIEQRKALLTKLATWSGVWIFLFALATNYKFGLALSVSRRLANLPYFLFVCAFNVCQITAFCAIETMFFPSSYQAADGKAEKQSYAHATSRVLAAYNRNGLAIFLVANLLTGLVNLTIPTLDVSNGTAMGIILLYGGILTAVAVGLDMYNISIKM